ncbi:thiamine-monophosphate kinase [Thiomicrospira aerophila AL3]|uniref:Thiamine-monophosphate kinase n=1 Tax=Thiomicrospira aerophila AL3 TaxID=717772 RepID=W0DVW1_9GAMM|nr:thiamine-phosphate kinase [Thiomicrospira aerophila]AHF01021.1 thiamine-monophosphate kinase [Thiomicrospira aerophila AL3]
MEFELINRYFAPLGTQLGLGEFSAGDLGIGDDGALITPPANSQLVVVTDTSIAGVHFPVSTHPFDIGWKALAVNVSDLAAMGARPAFYSLALTLEQYDQAWLNAFSAGLNAMMQSLPVDMSGASFPLIGGDTTRGPLSITITAHGWVERGQALLREGAKPGDGVFVSGQLGEGGLGLSLALAGLQPRSVDESLALAKLNRPEPRVALGRALIGLASSAIDISDGLLADLNHILQASNVGVDLSADTMPLSAAVKAWAGSDPLKPLNAGDDYELCFTLPLRYWSRIEQLSSQLGIKISHIGEITAELGCRLNGELLVPSKQGFNHFARD